MSLHRSRQGHYSPSKLEGALHSRREQRGRVWGADVGGPQRLVLKCISLPPCLSVSRIHKPHRKNCFWKDVANCLQW